MSKVIRLRAHHLLCMHGFRGLGYSEDFVANMQAVHEAVFAGTDVRIQLIAEFDDICSACPKMPCRCNGRVARKDLDVLALLGVCPETVVSADEILKTVRERVSPDTLERLCSNCRWFGLGYCREGF